MYQPSRAILMRALDRAGHPLSDRNWHLNLIGIRATDGAGLSQRDTYDDLLAAILDRAAPETVAYGFVNRLGTTGAHVMVVVPESEFDQLPPEDAWLAQLLGLLQSKLA